MSFTEWLERLAANAKVAKVTGFNDSILHDKKNHHLENIRNRSIYQQKNGINQSINGTFVI
jgi:hypothetical protein